MTYPAGAVTFAYPAFRTLADAQAWATDLYGWAVEHQKRFNALLAQTRLAEAAAIAALTDNTSGTVSSTLAALPDPANTPADADALRDDIVANLLPPLRNAVASLSAKQNLVLATLRTNNLVAT